MDLYTKQKCKNLKQTDTTEIPIEELVPGDIISLSAGDIVPADVRILSAKDLFVNQSSLTGEALPVENTKTATIQKINIYYRKAKNYNPLDMENLCFMGTNIVSGSAKSGCHLHKYRYVFWLFSK